MDIPRRCLSAAGPGFVRAACLLAAALAAITAPGQPADQVVPPANVRVATARIEQVRESRRIVGQIEPARRALLSTQQAGHVVTAPPEPGTAVTAGQVLARLDDELLRIDRDAAVSSLEEATAGLEERRALLETAERNRARIEGLVSSDVSTEKELADARDTEAAQRARLHLAEALIAQARARIRRLERQIANTEVRAPFDGFIVRKSTEVGQWIDPGDAVAEIVETRNVKARLDVPEAMVGRVPPDEPIDLMVDAVDRTVSVPVFSIVPDADPQARTFRVLFKIPNDAGLLKPGMSVSAELPTSRVSRHLTVPRDAVAATAQGPVVIVNRGGFAAAVPVILRFGVGDRFAVDGEVREGDQVIVEGNERLAPGQPLNIVGSETDPPHAAAADPAATGAADGR